MKVVSDISKDGVSAFQPIFFELSGQWLLDPNEVNGWGQLGVHDNVNSQDLGNVGANLNRLAGGLMFPFDVRLKRMKAWHYNSNGSALPWGWVFFKQQKLEDDNDVTTTYIHDEVANNGGEGPRDYGNNRNYPTDILFNGNNEAIINEGVMFGMGVASPTAITTNYYVRILTGFLEFERLS